MTDRQSVQVVVCEKTIFGSITEDRKYTPDSLSDVIAWFNDLLNAIPQEYRNSAQVEIDSVGGYEGEHHAEIRVFYRRPETDEEMATRITRTRAALEADLKHLEMHADRVRAALDRS